MDQLPATFGGFLTFLGTVGAIGAVLSFVAENWAFFQKQSAQGKMLILVGISLVMGFASMFAVKYIPAGVVADAEPYYRVIVASIGIVISSQLYHGVAHKSGPVVVKAQTIMTTSTPSTLRAPLIPFDATKMAEGILIRDNKPNEPLPPEVAAQGEA